MVLTRRSPHLRHHRWEVAFPGGGEEEQDPTLLDTALRESQEEIALDPLSVTPIGELDRFVTIGSRSLVHPFVGVLPAGRPELRPDPNEVERILHVPLAELLAPDVFREEVWPLDTGDRAVTFFELEGDTVWGATGAMLRQLLSIATGADPTEHFHTDGRA